MGDTGNTRLKQLALDELCQLCLVNKKFPELLRESEELLIFRFHHLKHHTPPCMRSAAS